MSFTKNSSSLNNYIFIFLFISPIYLWGITLNFVEIRHLILILFIPILYYRKFSEKDLLILLLCIAIFFHKISISKLNQIMDALLIFLYLFIIIKIIQQYYQKFLKTILGQTNLFLILFILSCVGITIYHQYYFGIFFGHCIIGCFSLFNLFFLENSHLGMISSSIIFYFLYLFSNNYKKISIFLLSVFVLICLLNYSLTFGASLIFNSLFILFFFWKKINLKYSIILILITIFSSSIIINNKLYLVKVQSIVEPIKKLFIFEQKEDEASKNLNQLDKIKEKPVKKNLSSDVWIKSLKVALISITNYPFGVGLNNFEIAHEKFINEISVNYPMTQKLNIQDASNNLSKIITEFGIFSLLLAYLLLRFIFSKNIDLGYKIFLLPNIFTQLLFRGAGYFNGGFIIFFIVMIYLIFEKNNK